MSVVYMDNGHNLDVRSEVEQLRAQVCELRRMLYNMTSLEDWLACGFSDDEYYEFVDSVCAEGIDEE